MKKLMIAAAIVCAAAISQAATADPTDVSGSTILPLGFMNGEAFESDAMIANVADVPEPTSGLLLLLGVAGLAHTCSHFASQSSGYALG